MIELLLGIGIFALAILPLIWLGDNQNKNAYSVGKHMMAGQLATSFLDRAIKLPYDECKEFLSSHTGKKKVLDDEDLIEMMQAMDSETAENDMKTSFRKFKYQYTFKESRGTRRIARESGNNTDVKIKSLKVSVEVFYLVVEGNDKTEQSVKLSALVFGEDND